MSADTPARRAEVAVPPLAFVRLQSQAAAEPGGRDLKPRQATGNTGSWEQAFNPCAPDEAVLLLRGLGVEGKCFAPCLRPDSGSDVVCTQQWCCCRGCKLVAVDRRCAVSITTIL
jgi:hypothetical protein